MTCTRSEVNPGYFMSFVELCYLKIGKQLAGIIRAAGVCD